MYILKPYIYSSCKTDAPTTAGETLAIVIFKTLLFYVISEIVVSFLPLNELPIQSIQITKDFELISFRQIHYLNLAVLGFSIWTKTASFCLLSAQSKGIHHHTWPMI